MIIILIFIRLPLFPIKCQFNLRIFFNIKKGG